MDRVIQYPGAVPLETDILETNKFALAGLSKLAHAMLGAGPWLLDFTCIPTSPAALNVQVTPGEIYNMAALDATAYSSLAADSHQVLKQGILWDAVTLACPAPTTSGYSINYLIEIGYFDADTGSSVLPYYNSASPGTPYSGPNNTGAAQNTIRQGVCSVQAKAGIAAITGAQATPSPDAGYIAVFVVTVAYGQTTITSANISTVAGAPLMTAGVASAAMTQASADARYIQRSGGLQIEVGAPSTLISNSYLAAYQAVGAVTFPGNFAGSGMSALVSATSGQIINFVKFPAGSSTGSTVGTATFSASGTVATLATPGGAPFSLAAGDRLMAQVASPADATLATITGTLVGSI